MSAPWTLSIPLAEVQRGVVQLNPELDQPTQDRIAKVIVVDALHDLKLDLQVKPWLDGAEFSARAKAIVTQTCGLSLDPFDAPLASVFTLRYLPVGSPNAPAEEEGSEVAIDPEADDPPEILQEDVIDLAAAVVEHLALEVDPFPRKPGAVFEQPGGQVVISPFAALAALKDKNEAG